MGEYRTQQEKTPRQCEAQLVEWPRLRGGSHKMTVVTYYDGLSRAGAW